MSTLLETPAFETAIEFPQRRRRPTWVGILGLWLISGVYLVQPDQQAVVTRFGAVVEPRVPSGLHYALPWPIDSVYRLKVRQTRRLAIGGAGLSDSVLGRPAQGPSQYITGDQNIITMNVVVQYSVGEPSPFLFQSMDVEALIAAAVESQLAQRVALQHVDDILTTEKTTVQNYVRESAQKKLDNYHAGVILSSVNIDSVTPPSEAAEAFRDVASARADAIRAVSEAQGYANDLLPRARGEAAQLTSSAGAYKESRLNHAQGDASRFTQMEIEYGKAPKVTADRAYFEAMEVILPRMRKLIVDSDGDIDLTLVRRGDKK